jgi:hypothetical protein
MLITVQPAPAAYTMTREEYLAHLDKVIGSLAGDDSFQAPDDPPIPIKESEPRQ